jgi:hypothetical protein
MVFWDTDKLWVETSPLSDSTNLISIGVFTIIPSQPILIIGIGLEPSLLLPNKRSEVVVVRTSQRSALILTFLDRAFLTASISTKTIIGFVGILLQYLVGQCLILFEVDNVQGVRFTDEIVICATQRLSAYSLPQQWDLHSAQENGLLGHCVLKVVLIQDLLEKCSSQLWGQMCA